MRRVLPIFLVTVLFIVVFNSTVWAAGPKAPIIIFNNNILATEVAPQERSGRMLVPVRIITEALGADVSWESQKVLISKNGDTLELTLNKKEVYKNGSLLTTLDVPPQLIKDKTMVPVRFISEAFGATVEWSEAKRSILINFQEKREGLTADEILNKAQTEMQKLGSYKFKNQEKMTIRLPRETQSLITYFNVEGSYKKTGEQQEIYMIESAKLPAKTGTPEITVKLELYNKGNQFYQKTDSKGWQSINSESIYESDFVANDPLKVLQNITTYSAFLSFRDDQKINEKECYTIKVNVDENKLITDETDSEDVNLLKQITFTYGETIYIEKGSLLFVKSTTEEMVSFKEKNGTSTSVIDKEINAFDYGSTIQMPTVEEVSKDGAY